MISRTEIGGLRRCQRELGPDLPARLGGRAAYYLLLAVTGRWRPTPRHPPGPGSRTYGARTGSAGRRCNPADTPRVSAATAPCSRGCPHTESLGNDCSLTIPIVVAATCATATVADKVVVEPTTKAMRSMVNPAQHSACHRERGERPRDPSAKSPAPRAKLNFQRRVPAKLTKDRQL